MKKSEDSKKSLNKSIGIFLCSCSEEISKTIDFKSLTASLKSIDDVKVIPVRHLLCQKEDLDFLAKSIEDNRFRKVIIAACSPQNISKVFEKAFIERVITLDYFEIVNIREGCAWVH